MDQRESRHLHAVQEHCVCDTYAVLELAADPNGHIGADLAVLANLGGGVHDDVALVLWPAGQLVRVGTPQGGQVQLQTCTPPMSQPHTKAEP